MSKPKLTKDELVKLKREYLCDCLPRDKKDNYQKYLVNKGINKILNRLLDNYDWSERCCDNCKYNDDCHLRIEKDMIFDRHTKCLCDGGEENDNDKQN